MNSLLADIKDAGWDPVVWRMPEYVLWEVQPDGVRQLVQVIQETLAEGLDTGRVMDRLAVQADPRST
jgi:hypothetical protein